VTGQKDLRPTSAAPRVAFAVSSCSGPPLPGDDHEVFLTLVYAEVERRWNKTPPFEVEPPNPRKKHGGREYQARCLEVLRWLHAEGDITSLEVSSEP
jgi:hypothetical protein